MSDDKGRKPQVAWLRRALAWLVSLLALALSLRNILVVLGAVAVVVGLFVAWGADEASTLLIVGAILLGLAFVLAPGWERLGASGAGWEVYVQRAAAEEARRAIEEVAESEKLPPEAKRKLEDASEQLATMAEAAETVGRAAASSPSSSPRDVLVRHLMRLRRLEEIEQGSAFVLSPRHRVEAGAVRLSLHLGDLPVHAVACAVIDPNGKRTTSRSVTRTFTWASASVEFTYADDFAEAGKLEDGSYRVEWFVPQTGLAAALVDPVLGVLARDHFQIRDGSEVSSSDEPPRPG